MSIAAEFLSAGIEMTEQAINACLKLDPLSVAALAQLHGKVLRIDIEGFGVPVYCLPGQEGLCLLSHYTGEADTTLRGTPMALLQLAIQPDSSSVMFRGDVTLSGDVELGQRFKAILRGLNLDGEELLARFCGDVVAHKLGFFIRESRQWWRNSRGRLQHDAVEYLQQELHSLPLRNQAETFATAVETLRDDVARLATRIEHLYQTL
jgi:ubiquinone biosynthesis protein UbiJ